MLGQISVQELKVKLNARENFVLVDCREEDEYEYCHIEGSVLIPLSRFEIEAAQKLKKEDAITVICHHGMRSQQACFYLEQEGYQNLSNVVGGIDNWSLTIDAKVKRY